MAGKNICNAPMTFNHKIAIGKTMNDASASKELIIPNKLGMHARAAARFVQVLAPFESAVRVCCGELEADGRSVLGLMMLAASQGSRITVTAQGEDAEAVLKALDELINQRCFDEES